MRSNIGFFGSSSPQCNTWDTNAVLAPKWFRFQTKPLPKGRFVKLAIGMLIVVLVLIQSGCQIVMSASTNRLFKDLEASILNSDDPELIAVGIPSFLILLDGMLKQNPRDVSLLLVASHLKSSFATAFIEDVDRQRLYTTKAREHALKAACLDNTKLCDLDTKPFSDAESVIESMQHADLPLLYELAFAWSSWILVHSDDLRALAQLSTVQLLVERMLELDETYEYATPHMFMGVFESLVPVALGGDSEKTRYHFERAISLSDGKNLYAKVLFAEFFARSTLDRELHDRLLDEVINADPTVERLTLQNRLAQQRARELKDSADDFF